MTIQSTRCFNTPLIKSSRNPEHRGDNMHCCRLHSGFFLFFLSFSGLNESFRFCYSEIHPKNQNNETMKTRKPGNGERSDQHEKRTRSLHVLQRTRLFSTAAGRHGRLSGMRGLRRPYGGANGSGKTIVNEWRSRWQSASFFGPRPSTAGTQWMLQAAMTSPQPPRKPSFPIDLCT